MRSRPACTLAPDADEVATRAKNARVLATLYTYTPVDRTVIEGLPELRLVATRTAGYSHIDVEAAEACGVAVAVVPTASTLSVAEYTFGALLALTRDLPGAWESTRSGTWDFTAFKGLELAGKTLGVVGLGPIGTRVAELGRSLGMSVLGWSRRRKDLPGVQQTELADLLARSDVVSVNVALTDETEGMLNSERLGLMKPTAYLINAARGGIVDEAALCQRLDQGRLAGSAFDVLKAEPPSAEQLERLSKVPNLLLTPHIAWHSEESLTRQFEGMTENILSFLNGEPQNLVATGSAATRRSV